MRATLLLCLAAAAAGQDPFVRPPAHRLTAAGTCNLTGTWVDGSGNEALIQQTGLALLATAVTPTSWVSAPGALAPDSSSLWLDFGAGGNLTARVTAGCTALQFANGVTWTQSQPTVNITTVHAVFMTHLG